MSSLTHPHGDANGVANGAANGVELREVVDVVIGVDTHVDTHTAAVVASATGGVVEILTVEATAAGYEELIGFADAHAVLRLWAIEGTGSHGAGLTRVLAARGEVVVELDRPERAPRRGGAKSDDLDAVRAAREALARPRLGSPRGHTRHHTERQALATLLAGRRSAVQAAGDAQRQIFALVMTAPEALRAKFRAQNAKTMARTARTLRTHPSHDLETTTTIRVLRRLARRVAALHEEAAEAEREIRDIVKAWIPELLAQPGIGPISAATILCAWSHPGRIHSEAAFAKLAGAAPIPATSGKTTHRHRLNRYGDRRLNCTLHTIVITRARNHQPTRDYIDRRTTEGKTPREIRRCLKRYVAREIYRLLETLHTPT